MRRYLLILFASVLVTSCKQDTTTEFVTEISCYSDYSTVTWSDLSEKYYRPNAGDWDSEMNKQIIKDFPIEISAEIWHLLQNARTDFHQKSLPLRAEASENIIKALDRTEAMFDTVFVRCVSQEYYMRLFPEMYNETMKPAIDELVIELANKQP
jgi:sulfur relay (sulfurtransferase) DsrC/TusE family protein